jgi:hypothetical protein
VSEQILASRWANALIEDAQADPTVLPFYESVERAVARIRRRYGGLWVGGRVSLTATGFAFAANAVNRAVQSGTLDFVVPLDAIVGVEVERGFITNIIAIRTPDSVFKIRCFGAARFAEKVREAAAL